jgi:hypothetical protein
VDNNLFLSGTSLLDMSEGGAYAHNLFAGKIISRPEPNRETPYHPAHSTTVAGLVKTDGGDNRFYNNIFVGPGPSANAPQIVPDKDPQSAGGFGLWMYDFRPVPLFTGGNVYYCGARPYAREADALVLADHNPAPRLVERQGQWLLYLDLGQSLRQARTRLVTTALLGKARVPGLPYVDPDDSPLKVDRDYFGKHRSKSQPRPGPFEKKATGTAAFVVR